MLSISDFSEMCRLSPQTLRFYHSEGLLVPADVNERTGYRSYTFGQVERAMLITVLRGAGMSVELVRRALDEPDAAPALLEQHSMEVRRLRQAQDEAIGDARELLDSWPEVRLNHVPAMTVASKVVTGPPAGRNGDDWGDRDDWDHWDQADAVLAVVQEVVKTVESCGAVVSGTPWRAPAIETPEQRRRNLTPEGPHWLVKVPFTASEEAVAALPGDIEVQIFEARDELSIFIPGKRSVAKHCTAVSRLAAHPLDAAYIDLSRIRELPHDGGVETAVAIRGLDDTDTVG